MKPHFLPFLVLLTLLLAFSLTLTACQSSETSGTDSSDDTSPIETTTEAGTTTESTTETPTTDAEPDRFVSAVFCGGPLMENARPQVANSFLKAGFNTLILGLVHVQENGDIHINGDKFISDGEVVFNQTRLTYLTRTWDVLKAADSLQRIEISIGGWGCNDFQNIRTLMNRDGDGEDTVLYKNLKLLMELTGAVAVNFDDESCYDATAMAKFGKMCVNMGYKVSLCPYTNMNFWVDLRNKIGKNDVDRIYVQCYDGGAGNGNSLAIWKKAFGMDVIAGYWCKHNGNQGGTYEAKAVTLQLRQNINSITGCFYWLYDDMLSLTSPNTPADYVAAINAVKDLKKYDD